MPFFLRISAIAAVLVICAVDTMYFRRSDIVCVIALIAVLYAGAPDKSVSIVNRISKNSFGIYLFHSPLIYITFTFFSEKPVWFVVAVNFVVWGSVSYFMTEAMRKIRLGCFIGE